MSAYACVNPTCDVSVVVPLYNERDNVVPLTADIVQEMRRLGRSFEVVLVNDGSRDGTEQVLDQVAAEHAEVRVIHFAGNRGQTIAIAAGMYHSAGRVIVLLDGDRQNDPADIGRLIARLEEGFDCVSGWRKNRRDSSRAVWNLMRRIPSRAANRLIRHVTGVPVNDLGCTLKAYRRSAIDPTELFGEMHRFLAVYALARGGRIAEMVVQHHPRTAGVSKYGLNRTARVIVDILLVRMLLAYRTRPSHIFAKMAQYLAAGAVVCAIWCLVALMVVRPLAHAAIPFLGGLILGVGSLLLVATGLVAELAVRSRYAPAGAHPVEIARTVHGGATADPGAGEESPQSPPSCTG